MSKIEDHQDLLEKYWHSALSVITEYSSDIQHDFDELHKEVSDYAQRNSLVAPRRENYLE